jgi:hypothetical protein
MQKMGVHSVAGLVHLAVELAPELALEVELQTAAKVA